MSMLTLELETVNKNGVAHSMKYPCDVSDVLPYVPESMQPLKMKSNGTLNRGEQRFMIKQVWGNSKGTYASMQKGRMLEDEDLVLIHEYLQFQYMRPEMTLADPDVVKFACMEGSSSDGGAEAIFKLRDLLDAFEYVVFPVHADNPRHWTVLLIHVKDPVLKQMECWYFDWLPTVQSNARYARKLLRLLTLQEDGTCVQLPPVQNGYKQRHASNDCGLAVYYVFEVFMKQLRTEGAWTLYPDPEEWRKKLHRLKYSLYEEQQKWNLEVGQGQKPKFMIVIPGNKILDPKEMAKEIGAQWKAGTLKHKPKQFFTCGRCRYKTDGEGCLGCNPAVAEKVQSEKERQVQQLKNAIQKSLQSLIDKGLMPADEPADEKYEKKTLQGGGTIFVFFYIYIYIYIIYMHIYWRRSLIYILSSLTEVCRCSRFWRPRLSKWRRR